MRARAHLHRLYTSNNSTLCCLIRSPPRICYYGFLSRLSNYKNSIPLIPSLPAADPLKGYGLQRTELLTCGKTKKLSTDRLHLFQIVKTFLRSKQNLTLYHISSLQFHYLYMQLRPGGATLFRFIVSRNCLIVRFSFTVP